MEVASDENSKNDDDLCFVVFSDDWGVHPSSCQHLFKHIARRHPVLWVNTIGMRSPLLTRRDLQKAAVKLKNMFLSRRQLSNPGQWRRGVKVCQPPMLPYIQYGLVRRTNRASVIRVVREAIKYLSPQDPIIVSTVPNVGDVVDRLQRKGIIYYCVDDFTQWPGLDKEHVAQMEQELIRKSDIYIATSSKLFDKLSAYGKPTYLLSHGVDLELFLSEPKREHSCIAGIPKPRVGYFGLLDERIDQQLLTGVASRLTDVSFVITGPIVVDVAPLRRLRNVFLTGPVAYTDLPKVAKGIDVLLIPYVISDLTDSISPLKLKEYLATGKPIVSTPLVEMIKQKDLVVLASSVEHMVKGIRECFQHPATERKQEILAALAHEDWCEKAKLFVELCEKAEHRDGL